MIRFVRDPLGMITPDIRGRLPGRGVWVGAQAQLVAEATKKRLFAKSLKVKAEASPQLAEIVDHLLETDCLQMLGLANKGFGFRAHKCDTCSACQRRGCRKFSGALPKTGGLQRDGAGWRQPRRRQ